jgi:hypothetical protein
MWVLVLSDSECITAPILDRLLNLGRFGEPASQHFTNPAPKMCSAVIAFLVSEAASFMWEKRSKEAAAS